MKTFAATVAVWAALAIAGLYLGGLQRLLYWSGIALVLFWIAVGTVWLFRQSDDRRPPRR